MPLFGSYPSQIVFGEVTGLEPVLRFSISIMPALPDKPVNALLYPSNPQAGIELHLIFYYTSKRQNWLPRATAVWLLARQHVLAFVANRQPFI